MMNASEVMERVALAGTPVCEELVERFRKGEVVAASPTTGTEQAWSLAATYEQRERSAMRSGIRTWGMSEAVERLKALPGEDDVEVFGAVGHEVSFVVFIRRSNRALIACVRAERLDGAR